MSLRNRFLLFALLLLAGSGGGLASASWERFDEVDLAGLWHATDGREVVRAADVARMARDGHPLRSEDGWAVRRVEVRVDQADTGADGQTHAVQIEDDLEISFKMPVRYEAAPGTTLVVWACLRAWDGKRLALGQVTPE